MEGFSKKKTLAQKRGFIGEQAAAQFLREKGYTIVAQNWHQSHYEIDLIAYDQEVLVFVEVRSRQKQSLISGYQSVSAKKKKAFSKACKAYLQTLCDPLSCFRWDIIEVRLKQSHIHEIRHLCYIPIQR